MTAPARPPVYYVPDGNEQAGAQRHPEVEKVVARRRKAGDHVHTWTRGQGEVCPDGSHPTNVKETKA